MQYYHYQVVDTRPGGRVICTIFGSSRRIYRARLVYCNEHNLRLEDIQGKLVHHKDNNENNDTPSNLELVTHKEHAKRHPYRSCGRRSRRSCTAMSQAQKKAWRAGKYKERHRNPRKGPRNISEQTLLEIMSARDNGSSWSQISFRFNLKRTTVRRSYKYVKEKHGSFI